MVSKVFEICNAYESGYGHGLENDGHNGEYYNDPDLNEAYKIGYDAGAVHRPLCPEKQPCKHFRPEYFCALKAGMTE